MKRSLLPLLLLLAAGMVAAMLVSAQVADRQFDSGRYHAAAAGYNRPHLQALPGSEFLFLSGAALHFAGDHSAAIEAFRRAVSRSPRRVDKSRVLTNKGNALAATGAFEEAIEAFRDAMRLDPANSRARHNHEILLRGHTPDPSREDHDSEGAPDTIADERDNAVGSAGASAGETGEDGGPPSGEDESHGRPSEGGATLDGEQARRMLRGLAAETPPPGSAGPTGRAPRPRVTPDW
jgi:tetratricopeptide (TPR) repeat protein